MILMRATNPYFKLLSEAALLAVAVIGEPIISQLRADSTAGTDRHLLQTYALHPLLFEANEGQRDSRVRFVARGRGYTLFLASDEMVLVGVRQKGHSLTAEYSARSEQELGSLVLRMKLTGASRNVEVTGEWKQAGRSSYFVGSDPKQWRTGIANYLRVRYKNIYPGIDVIYYGHGGELEHDFVLAPSADPRVINWKFQGANRLRIDAHGDLIVRCQRQEVLLRHPRIYQQIDGLTRDIAGGYTILGKNRVGFWLSAYDQSQPLTIDPILSYSTFLGGSYWNVGAGIAVDLNGYAYVAGTTASTNFPTQYPIQATCHSCGTPAYPDAFVTKFDPTGSFLVYSTYLGGSGEDTAWSIAVDSAGNAYVVGRTNSSDFPVVNPLFTYVGFGYNGFVTKINAEGSALIYSTYLGPSSTEASAIAADSDGNAYIVGRTNSRNFPTTPGAFQTAFQSPFGDAYVSVLNPTGSAFVYSSYLGGTRGFSVGNSIAVNATGNVFVTGQTKAPDFPTTPSAYQRSLRGNTDAFVTGFDPQGRSLIYSSYLGGSVFDNAGTGIALDGDGNAYVAGQTWSPDFPTTMGAFQTSCGSGFTHVCAFVTAFDPVGATLIYSTFLGGNDATIATGLALNPSHEAFVVGTTRATDFPVRNPLQSSFAGGYNGDVFISQLNASGSDLIFSTYLSV